MATQKSFKANIGKMYAMRLLYNMYFISAVLVPFYTLWGKIKFSQILFLNAWFFFWNFLLEIPTGTVADFLGRRVSLMLGSIVGAVGALVYVSYPHFAVFLGAEIIFALSYTLLSGADEALVYDSLTEIDEADTSKKVLARLEQFKLAGIMVGAAAGGFIAKALGLRMPLVLQAIPMTIAFFIGLSLKEPPVSREKPALSFGAYKKLLGDGVRFFRGSRILKVLTLDMVVVNAFAWIILWFYQALLQKSGVDIIYFGFVHTGMTIIEIMVLQNVIRMEKWLGSKKRVLFFSAFITGVFFIVLGFTTYTPLVIAGILISAGYGLTRGPLISNYLNKYIPSDKRATVLSTTSMLRTFAIVIINSIAGILADWSIPKTLIILGAATILFASFSQIKEEDLID